MPKKRTARVTQVKEILIEKIEEGHRRPGNWFLSNREVAGRYNISYQTAHSLISELCAEGYLHRTEASGTYVASETNPPSGVALILHHTSKTEERRFGAILQDVLEAHLQEEHIEYDVQYENTFTEYPPDRFCVIWGGHYDLHDIPDIVHYSVLIDRTPQPGLNSVFTDSISVDLYSAGVSAAQLLQKNGSFERPAVMMGTPGVWEELLDGFKTLFTPVAVEYTEDWEDEQFEASLKRLKDQGPFDCLFCGNNTSSEIAKKMLGDDFPMVAYGDETRAVKAGVTALTIPWQEIAQEVLDIYRKRRNGDSSAAKQRLLSPNVVLAPGWRK
jgi:DNA-binding transcriptional regulator YhcF (GntR family)